MSNEIKIVTVVGILVALLIGGVTYLSLKASPADSSGTQVAADSSLADAGQLVRPGTYSKGPENAKVTVVEFADYQCPACRLAFNQLNTIEEEYRGKSVRFVFRNFPLASHRNALIAHNAAEEAGKQGKFWEMHHKLYQKQDEWTADGPNGKTNQQAKAIIVGYARDLGLDTKSVSSAISENRYSDLFARDLADGEKLGVSGTPTLFVNGSKVQYIQALRQAIDSELSK